MISYRLEFRQWSALIVNARNSSLGPRSSIVTVAPRTRPSSSTYRRPLRPPVLTVPGRHGLTANAPTLEPVSNNLPPNPPPSTPAQRSPPPCSPQTPPLLPAQTLVLVGLRTPTTNSATATHPPPGNSSTSPPAGRSRSRLRRTAPRRVCRIMVCLLSQR